LFSTHSKIFPLLNLIQENLSNKPNRPMSLQLNSVVNSAVPADELVWIRAVAACNLQGYAVVDRTFSEQGDQSNTFRHLFLFPNHQVALGDWVALHTGIGQTAIENNNQDTRTHHFYWGANACVWNNNGDRASLIRYTKINEVVVPAV
jgi:hypothetical protein